MKKILYFLFILSILPLSSSVAEETRAERRQRIMRKYLQKETQLGAVATSIPSDKSEDDADVLESEQMITPQVDLQRQDTGTSRPMPPPPPRRRTRTPLQKNWLLIDDESEDSEDSDKKKKSTRSSSDLYSQESRDAEYDRQNSRQRGYRSYSETLSKLNMNNGNQKGDSQAEPYQSTSKQSYSTLFGTQNGESTGIDLTTLKLPAKKQSTTTPSRYRSKSYDSNNSTLNKSDYSYRTQSSKKSYSSTPYQNESDNKYKKLSTAQSYKTRSNEAKTKKTSYQKWQKRSNTYDDPLGDKAFIDALLPQNKK